MFFVGKISSELSSERKIEAFLTCLAKKNVSASTQNQAFNAIVFFYKNALRRDLREIDALRAKKPITIRNAPSIQETHDLLNSIRDESGYPARLVVHLLYGCGLRLNEPLSLRIRDVRFENMHFVIRHAKGGKDRIVSIPCSQAAKIKAQIEVARVIWMRDVASGIPIKLPNQLARKYPQAQFSWQWAWLFPQAAPCRDPRGGETVRWHMLDSVVQRAVKRACRKLGLDIKPHELRHGYATHCLNRGVNPRAIQQSMGHSSLETTMGYLHAESMSVPSPLEALI